MDRKKSRIDHGELQEIRQLEIEETDPVPILGWLSWQTVTMMYRIEETQFTVMSISIRWERKHFMSSIISSS